MKTKNTITKRLRARSSAVRPLACGWLKPAAAGVFAFALAACAQVRPYVPPSEGHISQEKKAAATPAPEIPPPAKVSSFVPAPQPAVKPQTYSVVVNEVPVKELLNALARDTKQNIDIHPTVSGVVSLNAIDETLPAILERISKQVDIRYRTEGNTIIVSPDLPYMKTYVVNYVNIQRNTTSTTGASGNIGNDVSYGGGGSGGGGGGNSGGGGGGGSSAGGNSSATTVTTTSSSDFWRLLETAVRGILNSALQQSLSAEAKQQRLRTLQQEQELRVKQLEATARGGAVPSGAAAAARPAGAPVVPASLLPEDVIVNPLAGTITVNGTEKQHQLVQDYLTKVERGAQRQVLIEATIVEVQLSNAYQGGVDWSRVSQSAGLAFQSSLIGPRLAAAPFFALFYNQNNQRQGDISLTVKLLEQFGRTKVLSSPKLMALNNQTALLKVVTNLVYFEVQVQQGIVTTTGAITPATINTTARTVSEGVVMSVTPQINDDGRVTLTVRPTISDRVGNAPDPNPMLIVANSVPIMRVREMESVLQVANGQTIVLGGLMQDRSRFDRDQMPIVGDVPTLGEAFRFRDEQASKTELIIFLRPTVIENAGVDSDELKFFQRYLPSAGGARTERGAPAP
jgi:MSHA type pilus biogenesis protein MshL